MRLRKLVPLMLLFGGYIVAQEVAQEAAQETVQETETQLEAPQPMSSDEVFETVRFFLNYLGGSTDAVTDRTGMYNVMDLFPADALFLLVTLSGDRTEYFVIVGDETYAVDAEAYFNLKNQTYWSRGNRSRVMELTLFDKRETWECIGINFFENPNEGWGGLYRMLPSEQNPVEFEQYGFGWSYSH